MKEITESLNSHSEKNIPQYEKAYASVIENAWNDLKLEFDNNFETYEKVFGLISQLKDKKNRDYKTLNAKSVEKDCSELVADLLANIEKYKAFDMLIDIRWAKDKQKSEIESKQEVIALKHVFESELYEFSKEEKEMINLYRELDNKGKTLAMAEIYEQHERLKDEIYKMQIVENTGDEVIYKSIRRHLWKKQLCQSSKRPTGKDTKKHSKSSCSYFPNVLILAKIKI